MIQILLKDKEGMITRVMTSVEELATALNDPFVNNQRNLTDLLVYVMRNHYHTNINGVPYFHSNVSIGINKPVEIVFTELDMSSRDKVRVVLKDNTNAVSLDREMEIKDMANLLDDPQVSKCTNESDLEPYIMNHHYTTKINGETYRHKEFSMGRNQTPTFIIVKM